MAKKLKRLKIFKIRKTAPKKLDSKEAQIVESCNKQFLCSSKDKNNESFVKKLKY